MQKMLELEDGVVGNELHGPKRSQLFQTPKGVDVENVDRTISAKYLDEPDAGPVGVEPGLLVGMEFRQRCCFDVQAEDTGARGEQ